MRVSTLFRVLIHTGAILSVVIKIMILRTVGTVSVFIDILKVTLADTLLQIIAPCLIFLTIFDADFLQFRMLSKSVHAFTWSFHIHVDLMNRANQTCSIPSHIKVLSTATLSHIIHPMTGTFRAARSCNTVLKFGITHTVTKFRIVKISPATVWNASLRVRRVRHLSIWTNCAIDNSRVASTVLRRSVENETIRTVSLTIVKLGIASTVTGVLVEIKSFTAIRDANVWAIRIKIKSVHTFAIAFHINIMHMRRTGVTDFISSHVKILATAASSSSILPMTGSICTVCWFYSTVLKYSVEIVPVLTIFVTMLGHLIPEKSFVTVTETRKIMIVRIWQTVYTLSIGTKILQWIFANTVCTVH